MAKTRGPRIRKTEASGRSKKSRKIKSIKPRNKFTTSVFSVFGFVGKVFSKITPGFLKGAFAEVKQVTWPDRSETLRLTWAVFVFAIVFSVIVAALDFVLDKIFKSIILG